LLIKRQAERAGLAVEAEPGVVDDALLSLMINHIKAGTIIGQPSAAKLVVGAPTAEATNGGVRVAEAIIIVKYSVTVILRRLLLRKKLQ
jgi:hypothetical protein